MKNNKIFRIVFVIFLVIVLSLLMHMAKNTTPPWEKKKTSVQKAN